MAKIASMHQTYLIRVDEYLKAKKEIDIIQKDSSEEDPDPFTLTDYVNMVINTLVEEGATIVGIESINPSMIFIEEGKIREEYIFMIVYLTAKTE